MLKIKNFRSTAAKIFPAIARLDVKYINNLIVIWKLAIFMKILSTIPVGESIIDYYYPILEDIKCFCLNYETLFNGICTSHIFLLCSFRIHFVFNLKIKIKQFVYIIYWFPEKDVWLELQDIGSFMVQPTNVVGWKTQIYCFVPTK